MKTLFDISTDGYEGQSHTLLMELGPTYCANAWLHNDSKILTRLQYTSFDEKDLEEKLTAYFAGTDTTNISSLILCSGFPQALLVPQKFVGQEHNLLKAVYDLPYQVYFSDEIEEWQVSTIFSLPEFVQTKAGETFSSVQYKHVYVPALKIHNGFTAANQLLVHFTGEQFRVIFKMDSAIQLAQTYAYKSPLDVIYYLLKITSEFGLDSTRVDLILSGLIEQNSAVYKELSLYFLNLHFANPPQISGPAGEHPYHFFTSLYNLAACVL